MTTGCQEVPTLGCKWHRASERPGTVAPGRRYVLTGQPVTMLTPYAAATLTHFSA